MSAAEHLQEAIDVGCTRDDHDHVADHRAEVLREAGDVADRHIAAIPRTDPDAFAKVDTIRGYSDELHAMADGKDTGDAVQAPAGESTQPAVGTCGRARSTGQPCPDHPAVPRTERSYWVAIAEALNIAGAAGIAVGIDMEGILTDHLAWSVVWNREAQWWEVGGYEDDSPAEATASAEDWVICCSTSPRCPHGERRGRAVERGWTKEGRAGNWLCAEHSPSDFFRPGHAYTRPSHGRTVTFHVTHISAAPEGSALVAFGWQRVESYDTWLPFHSADFDGVWTEAVKSLSPAHAPSVPGTCARARGTYDWVHGTTPERDTRCRPYPELNCVATCRDAEGGEVR